MELSLLKKIPLLSQGHMFVYGECENGLIQGDRVELELEGSLIPVIVVGLSGHLNIVITVDLMFEEKHFDTIKKFFESSQLKRYGFKFIGRSNSNIDFSKIVSKKELEEALMNF